MNHDKDPDDNIDDNIDDEGNELLVEGGDLDLLDLGGHDVEGVEGIVGHADDEVDVEVDDGDDDDEVDDEVMSVEVTVLYFAGCPSWQTALEHVVYACPVLHYAHHRAQLTLST